MIENLPNVPPAVPLLIEVVTKSDDWVNARKGIKSILKELRDQSEIFNVSNAVQESPKPKPLEFDVHLHGGLDLFVKSGACADLQCRLSSANKLVRSMGLIADRIWINDYLTEKFVNFGRITNQKLDEILADTLVLIELWPLIEAGIIRFRSPWFPSCKSCLSHFQDNVEMISQKIASEFAREIKVVSSATGNYSVDTGSFFDPPLWLHSIKSVNPLPKSRAFAEQIIYSQVYSALWTSRTAAISGGAIFSNSRVGLAGLLQQEGKFSTKKQLKLFDSERSIEVPWVSELNAVQILELRQEASRSLPLFREQMAKVLAASEDIKSHPTASAEFVQELREQAAEVRAELAVTQKSSARFWKSSYSLLGLGLSAYGVATDQVLPGVAGLLPLINLLINHKSGHEKDINKLTCRPSYVLVKAQDILGHAD